MDDILQSQDEIPNVFNEFYINIANNLSQNMNISWSFDGLETDTKLEYITTDVNEILQLTKLINISKSSGIHGI